MSRLGSGLGVLFLSACAQGAPLGFSSGEVWTAPLIGPLENNELVVAVHVNDHGPYLFVIDPDSPVSTVDTAIRSELELYTLNGAEALNENDRMVRTGSPCGKNNEFQVWVGYYTYDNLYVGFCKPGYKAYDLYFCPAVLA